MGFLRRFLGTQKPPELTAEPLLYGGRDDLEVVGESFHQDALLALTGSPGPVRQAIIAVLEADTDNAYDPNAVSVWIQDHKVGHLAREDAAAMRPGILRIRHATGRSVALPGVILGGGPERPSFGVFLKVDPSAFGLAPIASEPQVVRTPPSVRTGLTEAIANDESDDSYDLTWQDEIPEDRLRAMTFLRKRLVDAKEPASRHFMYATLEELLYSARDEIPSALIDFDATCESHHGEMTEIRTALVSMFGGVPLLQMYKQSAIRWQKAGQWETALAWAERGISVYGDDAIRSEFSEDLMRRAERFKAKLSTPSPSQLKSREAAPKQVQSTIESLLCANCGVSFDRVRTRGRKPRLCPECSAATSA